MNLNEFLDAKFEAIGVHKDAVVLLSTVHQTTIVLKISDVQAMFTKMICQYGDGCCRKVINETLGVKDDQAV
jgi:hypothetical protein